jgi:hypothetical protein
MKGTIRWHILDDDGVEHELLIPGSYYVKDLPVRLLSPQHLAQVLKSTETIKDGTICYTVADRAVLEWFNRRYILSVPLTRQMSQSSAVHQGINVTKLSNLLYKPSRVNQ